MGRKKGKLRVYTAYMECLMNTAYTANDERDKLETT